MTPGQSAADSSPAVILADDSCADALADLIADAFHDLAVSQWLIPDPAERRRIYPGYFAMHVDHALADGVVHTTPARDAVALWLPIGEDKPGVPEGYDRRLAEVTGPWADRFRVFDQELDRRHPAGHAHHHLAILAVRPDRQGQGLGTALLRAHHASLDRDGTPAYLEASNMRSRRLYLSEGYADLGGPLFLPHATMHPMLRPVGQAASGTVTASTGQQSAAGGTR